MTTIQKIIRRKMDEMSLGELRQSLMQTCIELNDYIGLYNDEYKRCENLQQRVNRLKKAQRNAHLPFNGMIE